MRRLLVIAGIVLIAIGKIFLAFGILALEDVQRCKSIDPLIIEGPNAYANTVHCADNSMNYFIVSAIFLGAGVLALVYGFKSKKAVKANP